MNIHKVTWEQYFNMIPRIKTTKLVHKYLATLASRYSRKVSLPNQLIQISTRYKAQSLVTPLKKVSKDIRLQLLDRITTSQGDVVYNKTPSLEMGLTNALTQLKRQGVRTDIALIDLGFDHYLVGPYDPKTIQLRMFDITKGALLVFKPNDFILFKVVPEEPEETNNEQST